MTTTRRDFLRTAGLGTAAIAAGGSLLPSLAKAGDADKGAPFRLGMASYTLRGFPLDKAIEMTKECKLDYICLKSMHLPMDSTDEQCAAAAKACADAGLVLYGAGVCYMKSEDEVVNTFRYAKAAGMDTIVGVPDPELLPLVDKKVKETGIRVAIHNHGPGDKIYPGPGDAYEKIAKFDKRIGLCMDIGHTQRIGIDPAEAIRKYSDRLYDMHLKDVTKAAPDGKTCACGEGVIDLEAVVQAIIDIKFKYIASFEYEANAKEPLPGTKKSVECIRALQAKLA